MERATLSRMLANHFQDTDTVILATKAINASNSQLIATLRTNLDINDDRFAVINNSTSEKQIIYYLPYESIIMLMKG